tara:strand:- start:331 stop:1095 length:765 start_codon:yes stop_codon:yes gene_type:complete
MKYNIFTVLNEGYERFGILFLSSIIDNLELDNIENIFVYDTGLSEETKSKYDLFDKVKIVDTGIDTGEDTRVHGETWQKNVYSKAKFLKHCVKNQESFLPTVMVDADSIFVKEFFHLVNMDSQIVLCKRSKRGRSKNHISTSSHIGSFFCINERSKQTIEFLDSWIQKIELAPDKHPLTGAYVAKESPSLSSAYEQFKENMKISELPEPIISNIEMFPPRDAVIYHLKSDAGYMTVEARTLQPRARYYTQRYLA